MMQTICMKLPYNRSIEFTVIKDISETVNKEWNEVFVEKFETAYKSRENYCVSDDGRFYFLCNGTTFDIIKDSSFVLQRDESQQCIPFLLLEWKEVQQVLEEEKYYIELEKSDESRTLELADGRVFSYSALTRDGELYYNYDSYLNYQKLLGY